MGLNPLPSIRPPAPSELDLYRESITPKRSRESLLFHLMPVLAVFAAIAGLVWWLT